MRSKDNIQPGFSNKLLYLVLAAFLSFPVGGYIYNSQEFFVSYRVECLFVPFSCTDASYHVNFKKLQNNCKVDFYKNFSHNNYSLIHFNNKTGRLFARQQVKCYFIQTIKFYPLNKYHNDSDDDELRIASFIS